jgi:hypothetical protein
MLVGSCGKANRSRKGGVRRIRDVRSTNVGALEPQRLQRSFFWARARLSEPTLRAASASSAGARCSAPLQPANARETSRAEPSRNGLTLRP